jgi:transcriptional regulator with XRE-family HTH domain
MKQSQAYQERKRRFEGDPDYILHGLLYDLAEDIYAAMEENGYTQVELAEHAGMQASALSRFLNTHHNTTLRTLVRLATALGLELTYSLKQRSDSDSTPNLSQSEIIDAISSHNERRASTKDSTIWRPGSDGKRGLERVGTAGGEDAGDEYPELVAAT